MLPWHAAFFLAMILCACHARVQSNAWWLSCWTNDTIASLIGAAWCLKKHHHSKIVFSIVCNMCLFCVSLSFHLQLLRLPHKAQFTFVTCCRKGKERNSGKVQRCAWSSERASNVPFPMLRGRLWRFGTWGRHSRSVPRILKSTDWRQYDDGVRRVQHYHKPQINSTMMHLARS